VRFRQSANDFPLMVELGNKTPSWGLLRWVSNSGLRFVPFDDEGFTLRGTGGKLFIKGGGVPTGLRFWGTGHLSTIVFLNGNLRVML